MLKLPENTKVDKIIYKKLIYQKFSKELFGNRKKEFDEDIKKITITNELSSASLNIQNQDEKNIFVIRIDLKRKEINEKNISLITRLFKQRLLIVLKYGEEIKLAIYETKLLTNKWQNEEEVEINIEYKNLSKIWEKLVVQISKIEIEEGNKLEEQIKKESKKEKLQKKINDIEKKARKEIQSKKKLELFKEVKKLKKELEKI